MFLNKHIQLIYRYNFIFILIINRYDEKILYLEDIWSRKWQTYLRTGRTTHLSKTIKKTIKLYIMEYSYQSNKVLHVGVFRPIKKNKVLYDGIFWPIKKNKVLYDGIFRPIKKNKVLYDEIFWFNRNIR